MIFDSPELSVVICIVQVSFVVITGIFLNTLLIRKRALLASSTGNTTVCIVAILTAAMFVPMAGLAPASWSRNAATQIELQQVHTELHGNSQPNLPEVEFSKTASDQSNSGMSERLEFDFAGLGHSIAPLLKERTSLSAFRVTACIAFVLILIGVIRFLNSVLQLVHLVGQSQESADPRLHAIAEKVGRLIGCDLNVQFRECQVIESAAVIGCCQPKILLPQQWQGWTDDELECVIAHEFAHILNHDFAWRLVHCFMSTIHCFNPLFYLLSRRITLAQEIAADALAAECLGKKNYVRCLSRLLLQQRPSNTNQTGSGIAPVFSGYLIRRIKMLTKESNNTNVSNSVFAKLVSTGILLLVGFIALANGAFAGAQQGETTSPRDHAAEENSTETSLTKDSENSISKMFHLEPLDLSNLNRCQQGVVSIALDELRKRLKTDELGIDALLNKQIAEFLHEALTSFTKPTVDISQINTIVFDAQMQTWYTSENPVTGEVNEQPNRLTFDATSGQLIMNEAHSFTEWISNFVPKANVHKHDDQAINVLSIPTISPSTAITNADDKTIVISKSARFFEVPEDEAVEGILKLVDHESPLPQADWLPAFRRIEGGLVSMLFTNEGIKTPKNFEQRFTKEMDDEENRVWLAAHRFEHRFETIAIGVDLSEDASMIGLQIRIGVNSKKAGETMFADMEAIMGYIKRQKEIETKVVELNVYSAILGKATLDLEQTPENTWEVVIENTLPIAVTRSQIAKMLATHLDLSQSAPEDE